MALIFLLARRIQLLFLMLYCAFTIRTSDAFLVGRRHAGHLLLPKAPPRTSNGPMGTNLQQDRTTNCRKTISPAFLFPARQAQYGTDTTRRRRVPASGAATTRTSVVTCLASINPFSAAFSNTFARRQRIREEMEELEDEDFLLADVKPKALVHERDFFRQSTRIQAWDEYVLVSILTTSISYGALQSFALNPDHEGIFFYDVVLRAVVQSVAGLASLCGLYSTMVFSLSILFGKTALGLERDPLYDTFLEDTGDIRDNAFQAFSLSLALFAVMVVLVLAEDLPLVMHLPVGGIMVGALYVGFRDWKRLVDSAEEIILDD